MDLGLASEGIQSGAWVVPGSTAGVRAMASWPQKLLEGTKREASHLSVVGAHEPRLHPGRALQPEARLLMTNAKSSGPDRHILPLGTSLVKVGWRARTQNEGLWNARGDLPRQWFLPCAFSLLGTHVSPSGWLLPPPRGHICLSAHPVGAIHRYTGLDSRFPNDARIPVLPPPASLMTLVECELWLRSLLLVTGKFLVLPRRWLSPSTRCP